MTDAAEPDRFAPATTGPYSHTTHVEPGRSRHSDRLFCAGSVTEQIKVLAVEFQEVRALLRMTRLRGVG